MLNRIILQGRLCKNPELRHTPSGVPVASFSLAVDRDFKDKQTGEKSTDFIDCVAWRNTAEFVSRYFTKGRMAVVVGSLQLRDWTDRDGGKRTAASAAPPRWWPIRSTLAIPGGTLRPAGIPTTATRRPRPIIPPAGWNPRDSSI